MDKYFEANAVFSLFCKGYNELKKDLPIRPSEMGVLNIIVQKKGTYTPRMLAKLLDVSKPMITSHITVLEKKGYIIREAAKEDKRSFYVLPTDKAKDLVAKTAETMKLYLQKIEESLSEKKFDLLLQILNDTNKTLKTLK
ncbi:MAG: MarR family transcriptional regulator [Butyrivibrio sp.]|nr:MarR family transcriptional regulator [Butyrivibrio sp.]